MLMVVVGNFRTRAELRKKPRRQFRYNASVLVDPKSPLMPCAIADISETGARIMLKSDAELPEVFYLLLTPTGEARRRCRVVWRTGTTVGVEFTDVHSAS
jgi:hypothetical protein